jgi:hypothetical protein
MVVTQSVRKHFIGPTSFNAGMVVTQSVREHFVGSAPFIMALARDLRKRGLAKFVDGAL